MFDQGPEPERPNIGIHHPVTQPGPVVTPSAEPSVIEHEPLGADLCSPLGEGLERFEIVVEVHRLPGIQRHRPGGPGMGRPTPEVAVKHCAHAVGAGVGVRSTHPRSDIGLARSQAHLTGQEQFAHLDATAPVRERVEHHRGVFRSTPDGTAHTEPAHSENPVLPTKAAGIRLWEVRPLRLSRAIAPSFQGWRLSWNSEHHRPLKVSNSRASSATGMVIRSASRAYSSAPVLVSVARARSEPAGVIVTSDVIRKPGMVVNSMDDDRSIRGLDFH